MPIAQLISPQALDLKKEQPGLVILDCRSPLKTRITVSAAMPKGILPGRVLPTWNVI